MNIVFWILLILILATLWFGGVIFFKPFGSLICKIWKGIVDTMKEEDNKNSED